MAHVTSDLEVTDSELEDSAAVAAGSVSKPEIRNLDSDEGVEVTGAGSSKRVRPTTVSYSSA